MKLMIFALVILLAAGYAAAIQAATPGLRAAAARAEISPAHKRKRALRPVAVSPWMWRGTDPSYGPGTPAFRQLQSQGRCVIDEGYGRFTFCSNL